MATNVSFKNEYTDVTQYAQKIHIKHTFFENLKIIYKIIMPQN